MPMIIEGAAVLKQGGTPRTSSVSMLVRIDTDAGVSGWGEGFGHRIFTATKAALDSFIGPLCLGRDPTAINALVDELQQAFGGKHVHWRSSITRPVSLRARAGSRSA